MQPRARGPNSFAQSKSASLQAVVLVATHEERAEHPLQDLLPFQASFQIPTCAGGLSLSASLQVCASIVGQSTCAMFPLQQSFRISRRSAVEHTLSRKTALEPERNGYGESETLFGDTFHHYHQYHHKHPWHHYFTVIIIIIRVVYTCVHGGPRIPAVGRGCAAPCQGCGNGCSP